MNKVTITIDLPRVIIVEILSRLPIKPIFRFKTVCKLWYTLLTEHPLSLNTNFPCILLSDGYSNPSILELKADYDYYSRPDITPIKLTTKFHLPPLKSPIYVVGSCNGFTCLLNDDNHFIYINNPLLGDYFKVKLPKLEKSDYRVAYRFCFSEASGKYKVLRLVVRKLHWDSPQVSELEVYTLGVDENWRNVGQVPCPTQYRLGNANVNGSLHWMDREKKDSICSFDIGTEKLKSLPPPPGLGNPSSFCLTLAELGNCLCLIDNIYEQCVDIWRMKEYGVAESWTKISISVDSFPPGMAEYGCEAILIWKDGEILMGSGRILASYNPKENKCKEVNVSVCETGARYVPSFCSLKTVMGDNFQVSYVYSKPRII